MQLKVGLFIQGNVKVALGAFQDHNELRVFSYNKFYENYSNYQVSIIYPFYKEDIEVVLNFISNNTEHFLIIVIRNEEIEKNSLLREIDKVIIIDKEDFEKEINLVLTDIKRQIVVNKQYIKFLYNLLNNNQLTIEQKKQIFNDCESFKLTIGNSHKDVA